MSERANPKLPQDDDEEDERDRRATNIFLLVAAIVVIGAGVWLMDAMIAARKADECIAAGRRNCSPIETPQR
jgi:hypothetical protein